MRYYDRYPDESYGGGFIDWVETEDAPAYNSWGNGAAKPRLRRKS